MRTEKFTMTLPVQLTEDERNLRGRQAARQAQAIKAHKQKAEDEDEAWKLRKKELKNTEETMVSDLYDTAKKAETGEELREVVCREELVGVMVIVIREDTGETVESRAATKDELRPPEKPKAKPMSAEEMWTKLDATIKALDTKAHPAKWIEGQLAKAVPESTESERKGAIERAHVAHILVEEPDGKLRRAEDDGVGHDAYRPGATH